ncbi:hypothetical protein ACVSQB_10910, partial [Bradyrhizobium elkanii]
AAHGPQCHDARPKAVPADQTNITVAGFRRDDAGDVMGYGQKNPRFRGDLFLSSSVFSRALT